MTTVSGAGSTTNTSTGSTSTTSTTTNTGTSTSTDDSSGSSSALGQIAGTGLLSSAGIGSGLDVDSIVTALVNAAEAGPLGQINNQTALDQGLLGGLTSLSTVLSSLQAAINELSSSSTTFTTFDATLSDDSIGSATTLSDATPGTYDIDVQSLATAQKAVSSSFGSKDAVGSGTLNITVGGNTLNVPVSSTDTLSDIASKITNASGNPGVTAVVINGADGKSQLVLSSKDTGAANAYTISASGDSSSGLSGLAQSLSTPTVTAGDAKLTIDGVAVTSASNSVSGAMDGVTLKLTGTGSTQLTVTQDTSAISQSVQDFVDAYNDYASTVSQLSSYDTTTNPPTAGVLLGDSTLASVQRQLSSAIGGKVSGAGTFDTLASLGITRDENGNMQLDTSKLNNALNADPQSVQNLFASTNGIAAQVSSTIDQFTDPVSGTITSRVASLNNALTGLQTQTDALNARMSVYESQLRAQYTNLDTLVSSLNNTSSFLTQSLEALNNSNSKNN